MPPGIACFSASNTRQPASAARLPACPCENIHHDVACRLVAEVLLSVDGAASNVVAVAGLEHDWGLSLDGEGDFALLDRGPLIAGVAMELVAGAGRHGDGYHLYFARRVFLQGRRKISDGLASGRRRLRPCGGREHAGYW